MPGGSDAAVRTRYEAGLAALQPRFALYEHANQINTHPWLADLVIWRAGKNARLLRKLAGLLDETTLPRRIFSVRGLLKVFFPGK